MVFIGFFLRFLRTSGDFWLGLTFWYLLGNICLFFRVLEFFLKAAGTGPL